MIERPEMTEQEARQAVNAIRQSAAEIGRYLLDLRQRQGWKALGYRSFTAMLEGEFAYSRQHLYRLMSGAQPDKLSHNVTTLSPDEQALMADLEVLIENGREAARKAIACLEDVRRILKSDELLESWCKAEWGMSSSEFRNSLDFEAAATLSKD